MAHHSLNDVGAKLAPQAERIVGSAANGQPTRSISIYEELLSGERSLRAILDALGSVIIVLSPDHRILEWNEEAARLYGRTRKDVLGEDYVRLFIPEKYRETIASNIRNVLSNQLTRDFENPVQTSDGKERVLLWTVTPLLDVDDRARAVIACGQDATERKKMQVEREDSRRQLREVFHQLERVREEERKRLSRQIHDELGQAFTALTIDLRWLEQKLLDTDHSPTIDEAIARISNMATFSEAALETVRRISASLRPAMLDDLGLSATIEWEAVRFGEQTGVQCTCDLISEEPDWEFQVQTTIYRIFKELLTNVARHAAASKVAITLAKDNGDLTLKVVDDGPGIRPEQLRSPKSLGILGMRERIMRVGGQLDLGRSPSGGTAATVRVPLQSLSAKASSTPKALAGSK